MTETVWRPIIPVESFAKDLVKLDPERVEPSIGLCWGGPSDFSHKLPDEEKDAAGVNGFVEVRWAPKYKRVIRTKTWTPVYSTFQVYRVFNSSNDKQYVDVKMADSFMILYRDETINKIVGYSIGPDGVTPIFKQRTIKTYLRFTLQIDQFPHARWLRNGEIGEYPPDPPEQNPFG